jgi:creatinine amidohydrolase
VKYRYDEMTWPEVRVAIRHDPVLVLPTGTTEQHGYHLPLMVDYLCATEVARAAVERVAPRAILMQPVVYSFNEHHMDFPGTITIDEGTIIDDVFCIGRSLAHHGFRRILILDGHGSNIPFMDIAPRRITNKTEAICAMTSWWSLMTSADYRRWRESRFPGGTGHACELETSVVLHLRPDLVDMAKAVDEVSMQMSESLYWDLEGGGPVRFQEFFTRNSLSGVVGEATRATAEKGRLIFDVVVERLAGFLEKFRRREIRPRRELHDAERYPVP